MRWNVSRAMLALLVMMAVSAAPVAAAHAQEANFKTTLQAAEQGHARAQLEIGVMYHRGQGVARDDGKAHAWFEKAAERGVAEAQFNVGLLYHRGQGVTRDDSKARAWFEKAAEQDIAQAQFNVGVMYAKGQGGPKDYVQAYKWSALSVEHGMMAGGLFRDTLATTITPAQLAEAKRLVAEWKRKNAGRDGQ